MQSSKLYSYLLVAIQFGSIGGMLLLDYRLLANPLVLLFLISGLAVGLYAVYCNKNFNIIPEIKEDACLIRHGIYRYIRHPMYFSLMVSFLGFALFGSDESRMLYLLLLTVLYLKADKEEKLWHCKDEEYTRYKQKTKMFIPFLL